ncbi:MAG: folate-binding protein YgfZ [Gammaproteobacteria bacterium]|nr:folate-binding protein YgfZ [Gammaproteobacteria bacterium]
MNTVSSQDLNPTPLASTSQLPDCALCDLSHLGLIRLEGEDALSFMQGQFTNDSRALSQSRSQLSALCSPKGRMLGLVRIIAADQGWLLQLPVELAEGMQKRLQMYVLRAKLKISLAGQDWLQMGLAGESAPALIEQLLGAVPTEADDRLERDGLICVRLGGDLPRFVLLLPSHRAAEVRQQLGEQAKACDTSAWKLLAIRAGEPIVHSQTQEAFVPQMANMQRVNGLSFTKGCFTGQEVVARMQYLGKLKRRMFRARLHSSEPVSPGMELFSAASTSGQGAGRVVEAAQAAADQWEILAVMEISLSEGAIHLGSLQGPLLEILPLPYAVEEKSQ